MAASAGECARRVRCPLDVQAYALFQMEYYFAERGVVHDEDFKVPN